jgi:hypothetical protein
MTGYLVHDLEEATQAVDLVGALDRGGIRASTSERFDQSTMVARYAALYHALA